MLKISCVRLCTASALLVALLFSTPSIAGIYQVESDAAIAWINSQQHINGSWGAESALQPVLTSEVVLALRENATLSGAYYQGVTWLENQAMLNNDSIARRVNALTQHADNLTQPVDLLSTAQRTGVAELGGWGLSGGYASSPIDTALTLVALDGKSHAANIQIALDYLKNAQLGTSNSGWPVSTETTTDSATTAIVLSGLQRYTSQEATLAAIISNGLTGLSTSVNATSPPLARALTSLVMLQENSASAAGLTLLSSLMAEQQANSGWGNDVYLTATILRATAAANGNQGEVLAQFIQVADAYLHTSLTAILGKNRIDGLTQGEMLNVTLLDLTGKAVSDLSGLSAASNLSVLDLTNTNVTSLAPLAGMTSLTQVTFKGFVLTATTDQDWDGINDLQEVILGTDPINAFPNDPAASIDTDGDGYPDAWNTGATAAQIAASVLVLDIAPNDPNVWLDSTPPVITLSGSTIMAIHMNTTYIDAGATALDNFDGELTANIVVNDGVNAFALGSYQVSYTVSDVAGNVATQVMRTVNVVTEGTPIVNTVAGSGVVGLIDSADIMAQFNMPHGVVVDQYGNTYVADSYSHVIRMIDVSGYVTTLAGAGIAGFADGTPALAQFNEPRGLALDGYGNLYVSDSLNHRIRKVDGAGNVITLAGTGVAGFHDDSRLLAQFNEPHGLTLDVYGNLYVQRT